VKSPCDIVVAEENEWNFLPVSGNSRFSRPEKGQFERQFNPIFQSNFLFLNSASYILSFCQD